ncbi:hypothetical protein DLM77_20740 [Leptospira yasudae]|uniref:DUF1554 domain-containing protein n=2 Tax=Leptospira yasudae TaxID=2202201 RepID=A0ABX9LYA9_9LEPT|nr:hypothetical protein DLM77_20740 [Leptospira yasudae]
MSNVLRFDFRSKGFLKNPLSRFQANHFTSILWIFGGAFLLNCAQAEPIEMDASHSPVGFLLNAFVYSAYSLRNGAENLILEEGRSRTVELDITTSSDVQKVKIFKELNASDSLTFSEEAEIQRTSGSPKILIHLAAAADANCEEENYVLRLKTPNNVEIGKVNIRIQEADRCMFFATANGTGFTGDLGGLVGADTICQSEKSEFLPGDKREYSAFLATTFTRKPALNIEQSGISVWPMRRGLRYYIHSNDERRIHFELGTAYSPAPASEDPSGILPIPLTNGVPTSILPNPPVIWSGYYNSFQTSVDCSNWTSSSNTISALVMSSIFDDSYSSCDVRHSILCIRQ